MIEDGGSARGSVTTVRRVGDTVRRPRGRWTANVHALLRHLADAGFLRAPRALGVDEDGSEILSFLDGEVAMRPWPAALRERSGVVELAVWLREYHDVVRDFRPPCPDEWFVPGVSWRPGRLVRHGDLGPWNSVWRGSRLVGFIDWDFAEPGDPLDDLAQLAWYCVPLGGRATGAGGEESRVRVRERLAAVCTAYGAEPVSVLDALAGLQEREARRITDLGGRGLEPWTSFLARGDATAIEEERAWLLTHREGLLVG
uniref:Aminoglycoside phosphotransferase n=1 Tax=Streptomyces rimofaciens TaxID=504097 RepID=H9BDX6_9ACTN|nr:Aminoglycoside phosphotransferase [Streptomyces rimofaciens]